MNCIYSESKDYWGPGTSYNRLYDPKTVENAAGEIYKIEVFTPRKGMGQGIHLLLKTDTGSIPVHLGPSWYDDRDLKPASSSASLVSMPIRPPPIMTAFLILSSSLICLK